MPQQVRYALPVIPGSTSTISVVNPNTTQVSSYAALENLYNCQWIWAH